MAKAKSQIYKVSNVIYVVLVAVAILYLVPIYMTVITSLKEAKDINLSTAWSLPTKLYFKSFVDAFKLLYPDFLNSVIMTVSATLICAVIGSINGYIFSKQPFRGSEIIFVLFLFGMFIPYQIILIPLFFLLKSIGLYGSIWGLVLAHTVYGIPIVTLIFRNFYDQIPDDILESAYIDGAGFHSSFLRIFLPLSAPGFVVVCIWEFTQIWNEFLWGICLTKQSSNPITVGLSSLAGGEAVQWNLPMAGSIISSIPVLLIFIFLGKYFIRGLLSGSVKS